MTVTLRPFPTGPISRQARRARPQVSRRPLRRLMAPLFVALLTVASPSAAQNPDWMRDLEDLLSMQITSAGRREQRLGDAAAAVFVLTRDEIRSSGMTTIPDLLRLVPGLHVARVNADQWAVTARGFNSLAANKLLVMVNGRSVYTRLFSGVSWELVPIPVEEIERVEVIRGPGASVWGANAVNGVINIITRGASERRQTSVQISGGLGAYGSTVFAHTGPVHERARYRLFGSFKREESFPLTGEPARGDAATGSAGVSYEQMLTATDTFYLDAGATQRDADAPARMLAVVKPGSAVDALYSTGGWGVALDSRWTRQLEHSGSLVAEASVSGENREDILLHSRNTVFDVSAQHVVGRRGRHDLSWGAAYRFTRDRTGGEYTASFDPAVHSDHLFSSSVQDEIALSHRLAVTVGSRIEYHSYARWTVQPSARARWHLTTSSTLWGAISHADRAPSRFDRSLSLYGAADVQPAGGPPLVFAYLANPAYGAEHVTATEAGYRFSLGGVLVDLAGYYNRYSDLPAYRFEAPYLDRSAAIPRFVIPQRLHNALDTDTAGVEVGAAVRPTRWMKVSGAYTLFAKDVVEESPVLPPFLQPMLGQTSEVTRRLASLRAVADNAPVQQGHVRVSAALPGTVKLDTTVFAVGRIEELAIPSYARVDARVSWPLARRLRVAVAGQNLFDPRHLEFDSRRLGRDLAEVPRQAVGTVTWEF